MILTIDSSVYLSAFLKNDPLWEASQNFLEEVDKRKTDVLLPILVPLEVTNTLHRHGLSPQNGKDVFESFFKTKGTRILSLDWALAQTFLEDLRHFRLKTADWIIAATCFYLKTQLVSWDKELLQKTKKLLKGKSPDQVF